MLDRDRLEVEEICILLVLLREPTHGYQVVKILEEQGLLTRSATQVYRKLRDMEKEGLLECAWEVEEGRRPRKVYRLSERGREYLQHCCASTLQYLERAKEFIENQLSKEV